tara:strand:+ start:791 stop:1024 length:234 start_codon:yes stop_codon:yes gene_type:complete
MRGNLDDLSNQLLTQIERWLDDEICNNTKACCRDFEEHQDCECESNFEPEDEIVFGRTECAESLQSNIEKWKKELEI